MKTIRFPGLVDLHVHLRDPGQTEKEDFYTGTMAALAGGYTTVFDMPNNIDPIMNKQKLDEKIAVAKQKIVCDIGFHFGSLGDNLKEFSKVKNEAFGLKLYLNVTTGNYLLEPDNLVKIYAAWPEDKPILVHAEADIIDTVLEAVRRSGHRTHVCHVSSKAELEPIIKAKQDGWPVTCGVTPHHLFLTKADKERLGNYATMKPVLKTQADQDFLWANLDAIDVFESDHAPHTKAEKDGAEEVFGVPGLETTLPLLLQAEREGKISREQIIDKCSICPAKIMNIKIDAQTYSEIEQIEYEIKNEELKTKCGWSPFAGRKVFGKVQKVFIGGTKVYEDGEVLIKAGEGAVLKPIV